MVRINVKVGPKGQIVIPKVVREEYNISPGDKIVIKENDQKIIIEKPTDPILELERISKEIKFREKIDVHSIEEGYGERWKKRKHTI
ncbi:AbrB/MazE/SpoVT family DNA-binding domain-containing protein [Candidatus Woesearchaeota archaeon]|nr:AbrB/MazE/SpoVT family DNA-binding domain-containing protein [Candidatus Woesearchaeota archaeon]